MVQKEYTTQGVKEIVWAFGMSISKKDKLPFRGFYFNRFVLVFRSNGGLVKWYHKALQTL